MSLGGLGRHVAVKSSTHGRGQHLLDHHIRADHAAGTEAEECLSCGILLEKKVGSRKV